MTAFVKQVSKYLESASVLRVFLLTFIYVLVAGFFVQFILIPVFLPQWHAGNGLLVSSKDAITFHAKAVSLAEAIKTQGWQVWSLRPSGNSPIGIAAAIYAVTVPQFWALLPTNALLHALAASTLWFVFYRVAGHRRIASLAIIPFVFFPSAMQWTAQWHKDGFAIMGIYLCLAGWILLTGEARGQKSKPLVMVFGGVLILSGTFLAWLARERNVDALAVASLVPIGLLLFRMLRRGLSRESGALASSIGFLTGIMLLALMLFSRSLLERGVPSLSPISIGQSIQELVATEGNFLQPAPGLEWQRSAGLPGNLDRLFSFVGNQRGSYLRECSDALSCVDAETGFMNTSDVLAYIPRATQIAFLAPFPDAWIDQGSMAATTFLRRIVGLEMILTYLALPGIFLAAKFTTQREDLIAILLFSYALILPLALMVPNMGTFHRFRYGPLMIFVGAGVCGYLLWSEALRKSGKSVQPQ